MKKRLLCLLMVVVTVFSLFSAFSVNAGAAMIDTEYGVLQDTSDPSNGTVYWEFSYNRYRGTATLVLSGDGYMPNATWKETWLPIQYSVQCYITEVEVRDGVKSIMESAFAGEIYLTKVTMADSVESIGDGAFANTGLKTMYIPAGVESMSYNCFVGSPIKTYSVDSDNQTYKSYNGAVYSKDMTKLIVAPAGKWDSDPNYEFVIPETVKEISRGAFASTGIKSITIPSNVETIGAYAFYDNPLNYVKFSNGIQYIYDGAFLACPDYKDVHLPSSVKYVGTYAFGYDYAIDYDGAKMFLDKAGVEYGTLNEDNIEAYLATIGYSLDTFMYPEADPSVTIYAPSGSSANSYALENGMKFERSQVLTPDLVSAVTGDGGMTVTWTRSDDAVGYYVYRKNLKNVWEKIAVVRGADNTSYFDSGAFAGKKNTYTVRAYGKLGQSYCYQSGVSGIYVPYVNLKTATNNVGGIRISWEKQSGVESYSVYRKASGQSSWRYIGTTSQGSSSYLDETVDGNTTYTYTVKGVVGSAVGMFDTTGKTCTYVAAPEFTIYNTVNGIGVRWSSADYADCYRIYRKSNGGTWQLIKVADSDDVVYYDRDVQRGTAYTYTIRAVYNGVFSSYDPAGKTLVSIDAPMKLSVQNRVSGVMVSWNKCDGAKGYYVYRKSAGGTFKYIGKVSSGNALSYVDKTAKAGENYIYTVRAYNGSSKGTYNSDGVSIDFVYTPRLSSATSTAKGITVKYTASDGCDGYYIYRRTGSSSWVRVGTVTGDETLSYTDSTAVKGTTYIYTVRAFIGETKSSYFESGIEIKDIY